MTAGKKQVTLLFVLASVIISLLVLLGFNLGMSSHIRQEASQAILATKAYVSEDETFIEDDNERLYGISIALNEDYQIANADESDYYSYSNKTLQKIADWAKNKLTKHEIGSYKTRHSTLYISLDKVKGQNYLFLVDVTPESQLVQSMSIILSFILMLGLMGAGAIGLSLGSRLEKDQKQQKEFFENASHELKTPLMVIQGYADGLQNDLMTPHQASQNILRETEKMRRLVDDILHLSRLESGALSLEKRDLSSEDFLDNVLYPLAFQARQKGIDFEMELADFYLSADPVQLERALSNILSNSLRYAKSYIRVEANPQTIRIANDGQKVSQKDLDHLFDRFYTGKKGNTGIGMALTQEIIKRHGWTVTVQNTADGVAFEIKMT